MFVRLSHELLLSLLRQCNMNVVLEPDLSQQNIIDIIADAGNNECNDNMFSIYTTVIELTIKSYRTETYNGLQGLYPFYGL